MQIGCNNIDILDLAGKSNISILLYPICIP